MAGYIYKHYIYEYHHRRKPTGTHNCRGFPTMEYYTMYLLTFTEPVPGTGYYWLDGTPVYTNHWAHLEPSATPGDTRARLVYNTNNNLFELADREPGEKFNYICEKKSDGTTFPLLSVFTGVELIYQSPQLIISIKLMTKFFLIFSNNDNIYTVVYHMT